VNELSWFVVLHEPLSCARLERVHQIRSSTKWFHVGARVVHHHLWKAQRDGVGIAVCAVYEIMVT
jgi:hypothetical protein